MNAQSEQLRMVVADLATLVGGNNNKKQKVFVPSGKKATEEGVLVPKAEEISAEQVVLLEDDLKDY